MDNTTRIINDKTDSIGLSQNAKGFWTGEIKLYGDLSDESNASALRDNLAKHAKEVLKLLGELNKGKTGNE